jgi:dihydroorotate dehydrogenase
MYKRIIRPILFLFKPENVHDIIIKTIKVGFKVPGIRFIVKSSFCYRDELLACNVFGIEFPNPVGLAAGFDKNAELFRELSSFGFSFIEVGTITPQFQSGNPKPRSFRLEDDEALINRMGFNNEGVLAAKKRLEKKGKRVIIGGNIGKNTATPNNQASEDYLKCFTELYQLVDYFVVNISCPNISNLRELQDKENLNGILSALTNHRTNQSKYVPILLKVSPDLDQQQLEDTVSLAQKVGLDGFVATNTTVSRDGLKMPEEKLNAIGNGGLSGSPIKSRSTEVIRFIAHKTKGTMPIIGVGGVMSPDDALEKLEAGASLIQLYTGFIYSGPGLAKSICKAIVKKRVGDL